MFSLKYVGAICLAKKSSIKKNERRKRLVLKYAEIRKELRLQAKKPGLSVLDQIQIRQELAKLPLNSHPNRVRNRDAITGRSRGYYGFFGLSRITLREMAHKGLLPGIRKASW